MPTKLIYMEYMQQYSCGAKVLDIRIEDDSITVILDQTVLYPQGGGQPYDIGTISCGDAVFEVNEVRYADGEVYHVGTFTLGRFNIGDMVTCEVDIVRRKINTRLHSIGHLIDMAVKELLRPWVPTKGYHFPEGAYIEYAGDCTGVDVMQLAKDVEDKCNEIIARKIVTTITFSDDTTRDGKPLRTVYFGDFGINCGGTHVANLEDIGLVTIRKIKQDKDKVRVSYA